MTCRTYTPVWQKLRKDQKCILVIEYPTLVARIKRMISKEKDMDEGFKMLNSEERFFLKFSYNSSKSELTIELTSRLGIREMVG